MGRLYTEDPSEPRKQLSCSGLRLQDGGFRVFIKGWGRSSHHFFLHSSAPASLPSQLPLGPFPPVLHIAPLGSQLKFHAHPLAFSFSLSCPCAIEQAVTTPWWTFLQSLPGKACVPSALSSVTTSSRKSSSSLTSRTGSPLQCLLSWSPAEVAESAI